MPDEPNEATVGVAGQEGTAPSQEGGVPPSLAPPTAAPTPKPVNLDDLPEFRKYKASEQQRTAEIQRQAAEWQRQAQANAETARVAAYNAEIAGKDDYEKSQIALQYAAQDNQMLRQQNQQIWESQRQGVLAEQNKRQFIAEQEGRAKKLGIELTPQIREDVLSAPSPAAAAEVISSFFLDQAEKRVEQARTDQRQRDGVDNVDVGAGASSSPDSEVRRERERYVQANDLGGLIFSKMRRIKGAG